MLAYTVLESTVGWVLLAATERGGQRDLLILAKSRFSLPPSGGGGSAG